MNSTKVWQQPCGRSLAILLCLVFDAARTLLMQLEHGLRYAVVISFIASRFMTHDITAILHQNWHAASKSNNFVIKLILTIIKD
jgi:hypothetical protein